jgi:hypothetical protein
VAAQLAASQEVHSSIELVIYETYNKMEIKE